MSKRARDVYPASYAAAVKRRRMSLGLPTTVAVRTVSPRVGYASVPRTRGAQVTGEMKYFDTERTAQAIISNVSWATANQDPGTIQTLFAPGSGAAINQRIGKETKLLKIRIKGMITMNTQAAQATADTPTIVRVILVQDKQSNASSAAGDLVIQDGNTPANAVFQFQSEDNFGRFRVLKDKTFRMDNPNISYFGVANQIGQNGLSIPFKWNIKFKQPVSVHFNAAGAADYTSIVDNSFHIFANCTSTQGGANIVYNARCCYKD